MQWKTIEYPPLKKYCLEQIYYIFKDDKADLNTFLKTVADGSMMEYFLQNQKLYIPIPEIKWYNAIYTWEKLHTQVYNAENNKIISQWKNKLVAMIDISKICMNDLSNNYNTMSKDFGEKYCKVFVNKYKLVNQLYPLDDEVKDVDDDDDDDKKLDMSYFNSFM